MTTDADNAASGSRAPAWNEPLARDVRCRCGYNLRGLNPRGRCPECGLDVVAVLVARASADGAAPAAPVEPGWSRQMRRAVLIALVAEATRAAVVFGSSYFYTRSPTMALGTFSTVAACILAVWWAAQWYAAIKLTRGEESRPRTWFEASVCWGLRVMGTLYLVAPAAAEFFTATRDRASHRLVVDGMRAVCMLASALFFLRVRHLCTRVGAVGPAAQATLLAILLPLVVWSSRTWSNWRIGGFHFGYLTGVPSYQLGDSHALWRFVRSFPGDVGTAMASAANVAVAVTCWVVMVRVLILLWRPAAAPDRRSGPSSPP